jgi:hypothetical protein
MKPLFDEAMLGTLTSYSVGTLGGCEAMMILGYAQALDHPPPDADHVLPLVMAPQQARELGRALLLAAEAAEMGPAGTEAAH